MAQEWDTTPLTSVDHAFEVFGELELKRWLCRGQSRRYGAITPTIDRGELQMLSRPEKLALERSSIELFRSTAKDLAPGEEAAFHSDVIALMVLRNYGVPTRLVDWSRSPHIAAHFAVQGPDDADGELWSFDEPLYGDVGSEQWKNWPETTIDGSGRKEMFAHMMTAFTIKQPPDWFTCTFYPSGFPRQQRQKGAYTMTAQFGLDHSQSISTLLARDPASYHLYVVPASLKDGLRERLRRNCGIWGGALFPDSAGAAGIAGEVFRRKSGVRYAVVIERARENYAAYVPDLPGCASTGETLDEVRRNIREAIRVHMDGLKEDGVPVPEPSAVCEYVEA